MGDSVRLVRQPCNDHDANCINVALDRARADISARGSRVPFTVAS